MHYQSGHIDPWEILAEVGIPGLHTSKAGRGRGSGCDVPTGMNRLVAELLTELDVGVVEILEKLGEERVTVCHHGFLDPLKNTDFHAFLIVARLEKERRHRSDDHRFAHALRSVF